MSPLDLTGKLNFWTDRFLDISRNHSRKAPGETTDVLVSTLCSATTSSRPSYSGILSAPLITTIYLRDVHCQVPASFRLTQREHVEHTSRTSSRGFERIIEAELSWLDQKTYIRFIGVGLPLLDGFLVTFRAILCQARIMTINHGRDADHGTMPSGNVSKSHNDDHSRPSIFVMDPYHPEAIAKLQAASGLRIVLPSDPARNEYQKEAIALLLRSDTKLSAKDLSKCEKLQCIVKQGVGVDNVDLGAAAKLGIRVYNTPGFNSEAVAELSLALAVSLARRVPEIDRRIRAGEEVMRRDTLGLSLYQKTLGIVGIGNIGVAFGKKWIGAMDGNVVGFDPFLDANQTIALPKAKFHRVNSLKELLNTADVVSLHVPLTSSTRNSISREQFVQMKPGAILLNAARGGVVDEEALLEVLKTGKLFGVGLDAVEVEPPTMATYSHLLHFPNVTILPHVGASTKENQSLSGIVAAETALEVSHGKEVSRGNRLV